MQTRALTPHEVARSKAKRERENAVLDLIDEGLNPTEAARQLGMNPAYGRVIWQRILKRMGEQAA